MVTTEIGHQNRSTLFDALKKGAFVIGSAALCLIAARNSITWHLQRFWGASGHFWQESWQKFIHTVFNDDPFLIGVVGTLFCPMLMYWIFNAFFLVMDITTRPRGLRKYKVQEEENYPVNPYKLRRAIKQILFNQLIASSPFVLLFYYLMKWRGCEFGGELPHFHRIMCELFVMVGVEEICFYYSHRLLHHPRIYKHIHKRHHEWTAPISITSIYCHPFEHMVSNMMGPLLGVVICGSHVATAWLWFGLVLASTTLDHSGYHLPFLPSPEAHDFHHLKFNYNFGALGILDRLHGTDSAFRNSKSYERHFTLLNLVPVRELVPDDVKKYHRLSDHDKAAE